MIRWTIAHLVLKQNHIQYKSYPICRPLKVVILIGGGNWRKTLTCRTKVPDKLYHITLYGVHLGMSGFELTTLVMIGTDCIGRYKSNYYTMSTTWNLNHFFSSPCQRQCELLPSLGICRPLTFHILICSSENPQPNELKLHYLVESIYGRSSIKIAHFAPIHYYNMTSKKQNYFFVLSH